MPLPVVFPSESFCTERALEGFASCAQRGSGTAPFEGSLSAARASMPKGLKRF